MIGVVEEFDSDSFRQNYTIVIYINSLSQTLIIQTNDKSNEIMDNAYFKSNEIMAILVWIALRSLNLTPFISNCCYLKQKLLIPCIYSRLSVSRIPRDSLKHFEISVP